jgi:hypothetical protein
MFGTVSAKCDVTPIESKLFVIAIFRASSLISSTKSAIAFLVFKFEGKDTTIGLDQLDFNGLSGYPASDIERILISTFSPLEIGISI